ncbi:hypothetical protein DFS34DRAFT_308020 [Phlyctochytrium arcticum]|nr:hypothetical protein DFS34DRAFT_308020 [Phlyctochytrium arcticum]
MKDFVVKLNSDNKISDSFDEDLSKFVWEKVSNDGLYPKTMYRMVLLGYVKAVEALRQHLDSVLVTDSKSVLKYTMISKDETSLDDPLRKEMMGPARDMFECKNGKGKGIDCPTKYRYPSADLNWIQKEDTNFKKHVWEKMQIPAQFLTTKNYEFWYHNGLPNQSNQKATWYNMFAIATTIDQAYMGSKSLGLFRGAVYDETQPELEKFLDENADKFFSCDGKSCHNFMDVNDFKVHDIQVRFSDETKFYDEVGEKFGLAKDSLKFGELKRDFFDKEAHLECAKKWNPPFPNSPNPCTKQKYTKEYRFNGVPSVNVETYPTSPTEATNNFLETSADRVEFLRNIIPEQDLSITVAAIEVAAGLVASGNGVVDYIKDYMDTIDDIKEESAQKEMAQKAMVGTIIMMILQAILFSFLPGAGPILAAANGAFQAVKATSMAVRIGKGLEQVKNLRDLVKNTSSIGKTVKAISELASGLKKAMPTAVKTRVSKGGEVFTKTKEFAVCIASEIGLDAIYDVGFTKIVDAAVLRRDMDGFMDISLPHPHESFSFPAVWMNETLIANAELERRANAPPNCFLEWQKSTDDFRSNEYRSNCEKDLVAATPLCPSDKDPWYAADKKKWDGGKCGTLDLACDHILELEEIKLFAENLSRKYTRKEFCKDWPKSLSQELFDKINSKDNLRGVEDTVNQLKNNMIHGNTVSSERLLNEQVVRNLHHGFSDKDQMTTIRKKMSEDVAEIFKKYKPTDSKIDITGDINEWKLERQTASANVFKALDDRIKAGNMGALNPIEPKKRPANRMLAGLDISEEDEERIRNAQADEDRPRTRRAASGPCAKKIKTG